MTSADLIALFRRRADDARTKEKTYRELECRNRNCHAAKNADANAAFWQGRAQAFDVAANTILYSEKAEDRAKRP